ncbi:hypothetical protein [Sphingobium naphthae]|uniref:Transposase n=1 Tax=Sphingobium naphthae TaxID=1886786 RepID=A0ABU3ZUB2_9SPHN|nr:hypothetical protein [Sphingobium naphthae]MDV5823092.1 hypothetical protein [Sphingobium naphthae]
MMRTPAQLHQIAREERARRKAAWSAAGQGDTRRAHQDDVIWSNIVHIVGHAAGDAACRTRGPQEWTLSERISMARNAWATACKAETTLGTTTEDALRKVAGLFALFRWLRPMGWSPLIPEATT